MQRHLPVPHRPACRVFIPGVQVWAAVAWATLSALPARADTIIFKNGNQIEGILVEETDSTYRIKIRLGEVTWPKSGILKVERDSAEQNQLIEEAWRERAGAAPTTVTARPVGKARREPEAEPAAAKPQSKAQEIAAAREDTRKQVTEERATSANERATRSVIDRLRPSLSQAALFFLEEEARLSSTSQNFLFFYAEPRAADRLATRAEYFFEKILYDLGAEDTIRPASRARVFLVKNEENWKAWRARAGVLHAQAFSIPQANEIFILKAEDERMEKAFAHEAAHWALRAYADKTYAKGAVIPLWLNEGFANYEGAYFPDPGLLKLARKAGKLMALSTLLGTVNYPEDAQQLDIFYAEASSVTEFILTRYGREAFRSVVDRVLHSGSAFAASRAANIPEPEARSAFELVIRSSALAKQYPNFDSFERAWLESIG